MIRSTEKLEREYHVTSGMQKYSHTRVMLFNTSVAETEMFRDSW